MTFCAHQNRSGGDEVLLMADENASMTVLHERLSELKDRNLRLEGGLRQIIGVLEAGATPAEGVVRDLRVLVEQPYSDPNPRGGSAWDKFYPKPFPPQPRTLHVDLNKLDGPVKPCCGQNG